MIPLRDVIPSRTTPYATITLISLNLLAWFLELALPAAARDLMLQACGVVPADVRPLALLTSMFLHGSWSGIVGNLWFLWIFGDNVESRTGHGRFVVFYLLCGAGAVLAHVWTAPFSTVPTVGASGAIAGVMGAYFVLYPQSRVLVLVPLIVIWEIVEVPAFLLLVFWIALQLVSAGAIAATAHGGVGLAGHAAAFAMGALGIFLFRRRRTLQWD